MMTYFCSAAHHDAVTLGQAQCLKQNTGLLQQYYAALFYFALC